MCSKSMDFVDRKFNEKNHVEMIRSGRNESAQFPFIPGLTL